MNRSRVTGNLSSHGILFSDITNDRVGIGSTIPTQKLDVTGTVKATTFVGDGSSLTGIDATTIKHTDGNIKAQAIATGVNITGNLAINADSDQPGGNAATNYLSVGASQDLKLYHNGNQSRITAADGTLLIQGDNIMLVSDDTAGRSLYQDNANSRLELGFDGTAAAYFSSSAIQFVKPLTTTGDVTVGDDLTVDGEINMLGSSDSAKYFDVRTGASNSLHIRSSLGGASNLVTMLSIGRAGSSFVGNLTLGDSSDSSSAAGPEFTLNRNSSSPADADYLGQIKFAGRSDTAVQRNYAKITGKILDASNGTEDGIIEFSHIKAGSQVITGRWRSDSLQLLNSTNFSVAGTSEFTGAATFNGSINSNNALNIGANSHITLATGNWAGDVYGKIQHHANRLYLGTGSNADPCFVIRYSGTDRIYMTSGGTFYPVQDSNADLGKPSVRWSNGYFDTLYGDGSNITAVNATTLDSLDSTQFLRSDAEDTITAPLVVNAGTANATNDATLYVTASNNNDWGLKINNYNSSATEYGARIEVGSSANYALQITGNGSEVFRVTGAGTVTLASTLDGRDIAADGTKLDGIESGATADQTNAEIATALRGQTIGASGNGNGTSDIYNDNWFRNNNSGEGLYNTSTTQHWYSDDDDYWNIAGGTGANGIRFRDEHNGTIRGYVYANNSNQIGFLNQSGAWTIRTTTNGITKLGSNGAGYQIKDGNVANNLYIFGAANGATDSAGISLHNGAGTWRMQLYGSNGGYYGFLDGNWNGWDIQKLVNGAFKVDEGSGLQRVWNAGNDGSGSGLDADTVDGLSAASFVRADTSDTVTGAPWQLTNSGTGNWGFRLLNNTGTNNYVYFCHGTHGMHLRNDSAGTGQYLLEVYRSNSAYFKIRGGDCYTTLAGGMQITGTLTTGSHTIASNADIRLVNGNWTGDYSCKIQHHSNYLYMQGGSNGHIFRRHQGSNAWFITGDGHFHPGTNDAYDIGTSSNRVRNVYTTDLQLSNESKKDRGGNDVDGSWGDWTLQEGEDKIFMINNRTGKKYSLIMKEEN